MPRAKKHCGISGCKVLVTAGKRCDAHAYGWKTSPRTASGEVTSTRRWRTLRLQILKRDNYLCQIRYEGICTGTATEVDKIIPASKRPDFAMVESNLRSSCSACNAFKARKHDRY